MLKRGEEYLSLCKSNFLGRRFLPKDRDTMGEEVGQKKFYLCLVFITTPSIGIMTAQKSERIHLLNGVLFMALFGFAAFYIADFKLFKEVLRLSPLIIGIVMGILYANTLRSHLPQEWVPGMKFCSKTVLRTAIILYGFRLTFTDVVAAGWSAVVMDVIIVSSVALLGILLGKWLKLDRDTSLLVASGSAICGAAAVLGTEPVLRADSSKTVVAVSTVVIFGTLAMFIYPWLYNIGILGLEANQMGLYTGATLHEVAHVAGAGASMSTAANSPEIANIATITKMIRVILLAPFLIIVGACLPVASHKTGKQRKITIPWFAIWFMVVIGINTLLHYMAQQGGWEASYNTVLKGVEAADNFGLTMAMTAIGCDASIKKFKEAGARPFVLALILFVWLISVGYLLAKYLVPMLS